MTADTKTAGTTRRRRSRGVSVVEALVAAALAGIAIAGLATVAALGRGSLRLARDTSVALALAGERLEALRAGPRAAGSDVSTAGGTTFGRTAEVESGRGAPTRLRIEVTWGRRAVALETEALP